MKVAVTGALGFIGRHVTAALLARGITPLLVTRTAPEPAIANKLAAQNVRVLQLDLHAVDAQVFKLLDKPDLLIHLAWGGLPNYLSSHHFEVELPAQYRFLRLMLDAGLSNLAVTGTCFEYGMQSGALSEQLLPQPSNPYGFAKNSLRAQLEYAQRERRFNFTWARLFYLFGAGQSPNSLWAQLAAAVSKCDRTFNMSGGEQLRDYLPISEASRLLVELALNKQNNGVVNLCSGQPISVRKLVEGWVAQNGWSIELNLGHYPYPTYEPFAFWGDSTKLSACLRNTVA